MMLRTEQLPRCSFNAVRIASSLCYEQDCWIYRRVKGNEHDLSSFKNQIGRAEEKIFGVGFHVCSNLPGTRRD